MTQNEMSGFTRKVQRQAILLYARHLYNDNVPLDEIYSITNRMKPAIKETVIERNCIEDIDEAEMEANCIEWLDRRAFGYGYSTQNTRDLIALALGKDVVEEHTVSRSSGGKVIPDSVSETAVQYLEEEKEEAAAYDAKLVALANKAKPYFELKDYVHDADAYVRLLLELMRYNRKRAPLYLLSSKAGVEYEEAEVILDMLGNNTELFKRNGIYYDYPIFGGFVHLDLENVEEIINSMAEHAEEAHKGRN